MSLKGSKSTSTPGTSKMSPVRKFGGTKTRTLKQHNRPVSDSETESDVEMSYGKQGKCQSRNAVSARMNRIKKKNYIMGLERDVARYKSECENMSGKLSMQTKMVQTLRHEVLFLKNVLANSKELSLLIRSVKTSTGLPTTASIKPVMKVEPFEEEDLKLQSSDKMLEGKSDVDLFSVALPSWDLNREEDYSSPISGDYLSITDLFEDLDSSNNFSDLIGSPDLSCNVGVCLHDAKQRVSLEFCSLCNSRAASSWDSNTV